MDQDTSFHEMMDYVLITIVCILYRIFLMFPGPTGCITTSDCSCGYYCALVATQQISIPLCVAVDNPQCFDNVNGRDEVQVELMDYEAQGVCRNPAVCSQELGCICGRDVVGGVRFPYKK
ncbi:hypothetical protein RUND412_009332 [Rhizina undulata]